MSASAQNHNAGAARLHAKVQNATPIRQAACNDWSGACGCGRAGSVPVPTAAAVVCRAIEPDSPVQAFCFEAAAADGLFGHELGLPSPTQAAVPPREEDTIGSVVDSEQ